MMIEVKSIEVPEPLGRLGERFKEAGRELYLVGGFVRDALSGSIGRDVDATTGARVGEYDGEVTTSRTDLYPEGSRPPEGRLGESLYEARARRDFTINA